MRIDYWRHYEINYWENYERQSILLRERKAETSVTFKVTPYGNIGQHTVRDFYNDKGIFIKDIISLLQDINVMYIRISQVIQGDFKAATSNRRTYRNRIESFDLPLQIKVSDIGQHSPIFITTKFSFADLAEALCILVREMPWGFGYWHRRKMAEYEEKKKDQEVRKGELDLGRRVLELRKYESKLYCLPDEGKYLPIEPNRFPRKNMDTQVREALLPLFENNGIILSDADFNRLVDCVLDDIYRLALNPHRLEVVE